MVNVPSFREVLGAPASKPTATDSVLIIVDAQYEYVKGKMAVDDVDKSAAVITTLLEKYRKDGGDVVHVIHEVPEGAPIFTPNTELAQEFKELAPVKDEKVIGKNHPSSFTGTDLHEHLQKLGKNKIVIVGYVAHICISGTARSGNELGYEVSVVSDAIGDRETGGVTSPELIKVVLAELGDYAGTVISSSQFA